MVVSVNIEDTHWVMKSTHYPYKQVFSVCLGLIMFTMYTVAYAIALETAWLVALQNDTGWKQTIMYMFSQRNLPRVSVTDYKEKPYVTRVGKDQCQGGSIFLSHFTPPWKKHHHQSLGEMDGHSRQALVWWQNVIIFNWCHWKTW